MGRHSKARGTTRRADASSNLQGDLLVEGAPEETDEELETRPPTAVTAARVTNGIPCFPNVPLGVKHFAGIGVYRVSRSRGP